MLVDVDWRRKFPEAFVETLHRVYSDHHPILLRCEGVGIPAGPRPFRFEASWTMHDDYEGVVSSAWFRGGVQVWDKLAKVREDSIIFNKQVFGNIFRKKRNLENRLKGVQEKLERVDSISLALLERDLQKEYSDVLRQEELLWFQKSNEKWVKWGDRNTSFFHTQTIVRRKRNKVSGLFLNDGSWNIDAEVLKTEAMGFYQNLFCSSENVDLSLLSDAYFPQIDGAGRDLLLRPVTKEEVFYALRGMPSFNSPGVDGFQPFFFKKYWHVVGDEVWCLVRDAFLFGYFDPTLVETLLVLIPKEDQPLRMKDFQPISLCTVLYKLITKVLVNRLRPSIKDLVGPMQSGFMPGRSTHDNVIVAQEVMHHMRKSKNKKGVLAFKIDLEKAYDRVDWRFLNFMLSKFGFPSSIIQLIMFCVTSSSLSILWNGVRLPAFTPTRGLRQGDPMSPYLFILCMEGLSYLIQSKVESGDWKPMTVSRGGPKISHLLFADDVLLFTSASASQVRLVTNILEVFCKVSGLKVNVHKSRAMCSVVVSRQRWELFSSISSIRFASNLGKYLGFPLLSRRAKKSDFSFIIGNLNQRLASWKGKLLNKAGKLTLAKSVLSSIPIFLHAILLGANIHL